MSKIITFMTKPERINAKSFYPRKYEPEYLKVNDLLKQCLPLSSYISEEIKSGSTPPSEMFLNRSENTAYFVKTSAIERHIINVNDLYNINKEYHMKKLKRSNTKPYEVIYSMTGKYMGKAAMCPNIIDEINMSQNSVRITTDNTRVNAFIEIFLNSEINKAQVKGLYSITKQKYINQNRISSLKIPKYHESYNDLMDEYIEAFDIYYNSINNIKEVINKFNKMIFLEKISNDSFKVVYENLTCKLFTPTFYEGIIKENEQVRQEYFDIDNNIENSRWSKGKDIGSDNYESEGIPFIKTSDIVNFDVDYHPDCYCNIEFGNKINIVKKGDLIFTKDGKIGEVALVGQNSKFIPAGGIVILRPKNNDERYGMFLLLASRYGQLKFKKWSVIASTMTHLRKDDFLDDLHILDYDNSVIKEFINNLRINFNCRDKSFERMENIAEEVCKKILLNID